MVVEQTAWPLERLCGFASRRNSNRAFLFVSKVLGKHYPVRPSRMRAIHRSIAEQLHDLPKPVVVIGMAETAIALGQGVYECYEPFARPDCLFLHTTRYRSSRPLALTFQENHSHATDHFLYLPDDAAARTIFSRARSLVIVDDELSTGNTLANLMSAYCDLNPDTRELRAASITDWLGASRRSELVARFHPRHLAFVNLLEGEFSFAPHATFDYGYTASAVGNGACKDPYLTVNFGRFGTVGPLTVDYARLVQAAGVCQGERILVLGTGEFMYPPFLFAEWLETHGYDVRFQSTTRSPVLVGNDIECAIETVDNYWDGIPNYLYNVRPTAYDRIVIGYETKLRPAEHDLPARLTATTLDFA